jgi:streptomycin 6-kinase
VCKCLNSDEELGVILLERIIPGWNLKTVSSKKTQLEIGAELVASLPIPVGQIDGLPLYRDWIHNAVHTTYAEYDPNARMSALMETAKELFHQICPNDSPRFLLHGDLHHENILQNKHGEWKAIDPQGVIGAPFMESACFIENHAIEQDTGLSYAELDEAVTYFADRLGEHRQVIGGAVYILLVLSTCWGYQMNFPLEQIDQQIEQCESLLSYLINV